MSRKADDTEEWILDILGNPTEIDESLTKFREAAQLLSSDHPRMIERYSKQWIALFNGSVAAQGSTFATLMNEVDKQAIPRSEAVVRYIDRNHRTMIL